MTTAARRSKGAPAPPLEDLRRAEAWVFDLDNTLYPASSNLFAQVDVRIRDYIARFLGLDADQAYRIQKRYFREHGTSLSGMMQRHAMDPRPFLEYVHDIDLSPVPPSPALEAALSGLAGRKIVFTNGTTDHAQRVMGRLGVGHHFDGVFDIAAADYLPKPEPRVYDRLVDDYGLDPGRVVMVDDIARNLEPAAALGMTTVWLRSETPWGRQGADGGFVHYVIDDLTAWLERVVAGTSD